MVLFLLGVPCAIIGGIMLKNDIKYTAKDIKIPRADISLKKQYQQIDEYFIDILDYCGAEGDIYREDNIKKIKNTIQNQYGEMRKYLAKKGYYPQAIDYAINKYNHINNEETQIYITERKRRIKNFEQKLKKEPSEYYVIEVTSYDNKTKKMVEKDVEQILHYLKTHGHEQAYCNIIMGGDALHHNHIETWHLKAPSSNPKLLSEYLIDVEKKILGSD